MSSRERTRSCRTRQLFSGGARPPKEVAAFVAAHRQHGVVPICRTLQVAPSAVRSAMSWPVCARRLADDAVKAEAARSVQRERPGLRTTQDEKPPCAANTASTSTRIDRPVDARAGHARRDTHQRHGHDMSLPSGALSRSSGGPSPAQSPRPWVRRRHVAPPSTCPLLPSLGCAPEPRLRTPPRR